MHNVSGPLFCPRLAASQATQWGTLVPKGSSGWMLMLHFSGERRQGMEWLMLTVMAANTSAFDMYTRLGYSLDSSSPGVVEPAEECGYEILSKVRLMDSRPRDGGLRRRALGLLQREQCP